LQHLYHINLFYAKINVRKIWSFAKVYVHKNLLSVKVYDHKSF